MKQIYIVFAGPPSQNSGRFVEVEDANGNGLGPNDTNADWKERDDGFWVLGPFAKWVRTLNDEPEVYERMGEAERFRIDRIQGR